MTRPCTAPGQHTRLIRDQAPFVLLREVFTGWLSLPDEQLRALRSQARDSGWWLLKRERDRPAHRGRHPLDNARAIRGWSRLPVASASADRGIGRSVAEAVDPAGAAREITELVGRRHGSRHAHRRFE
jgi:hypothetical protein